MSPPASCWGTAPSFARMVPANPPMRILRPFRSSTDLNLLAEPATHLSPGIGRCHANAVEILQQLIQEIGPAAETNPGVHLAGIQSERERGAEGEGRVLAPVVVERGIAHLHGAVLNGVEHLQPRHEFARSKDLN